MSPDGVWRRSAGRLVTSGGKRKRRVQMRMVGKVYNHNISQESTASEMDWICSWWLDETVWRWRWIGRERSMGRGVLGKSCGIDPGFKMGSHTMTKGMYLTLNGLISVIKVFSFLCGILILSKFMRTSALDKAVIF